jgi:hypothetical protein
MAPEEIIKAWHVKEGDVLPGDVRVISVLREPIGRTLWVSTDEPRCAFLYADSLVVVVRGMR